MITFLLPSQHLAHTSAVSNADTQNLYVYKKVEQTENVR